MKLTVIIVLIIDETNKIHNGGYNMKKFSKTFKFAIDFILVKYAYEITISRD